MHCSKGFRVSRLNKGAWLNKDNENVGPRKVRPNLQVCTHLYTGVSHRCSLQKNSGGTCSLNIVSPARQKSETKEGQRLKTIADLPWADTRMCWLKNTTMRRQVPAFSALSWGILSKCQTKSWEFLKGPILFAHPWLTKSFPDVIRGPQKAKGQFGT